MSKIFSKRLEILLFIFFFIFSWWIMNKSFQYDTVNSQFLIARHQVGDFGLHLGLIRSFSLGNNFPVESPFFPGKPLPYHYYFDFIVGILERIGLRIDIAFNGLSALSFTALLYFIFKLSQILFDRILVGILSIILFIFHSGFTFVDFLKDKTFSLSLLTSLWRIPDYIHKGPFDGSVISIFFTLNVFLNQRHLIAGLAISLGVLWFLLSKILQSQNISAKSLLLCGVILGLSFRVHALISLSTLSVLFFLFILFGKLRSATLLFITAIILVAIQAKDIVTLESHKFYNPGFIIGKPLTLLNFSEFWFLNLGFLILYVFIGFILSNSHQKKVLLSFTPLFILGNIFQFSYRIEHNHSIFNFFLIILNIYAAFFLYLVWKRKKLFKLLCAILLGMVTFSGLIDLMVIKNDYRYPFDVSPANAFMEWVQHSTKKGAIFLEESNLLDQVVISGRKNYMGNEFYLSVMGYDFSERKTKKKLFFEAKTSLILEEARKEHISYYIIPLKKTADFNYHINRDFLLKNLRLAYQNRDVLVLSL